MRSFFALICCAENAKAPPRDMHVLAPFTAWREKTSRGKKASRKGAENAKAAQGCACLSALSGLARRNIPREKGLSQRRGERQGCAGVCMP